MPDVAERQLERDRQGDRRPQADQPPRPGRLRMGDVRGNRRADPENDRAPGGGPAAAPVGAGVREQDECRNGK